MTTSPHAGAEGADLKVIGLVDELDDPSPGHLSDHPQALTATTTVADTTKPEYKSLGDRFTKGETEEQAGGGENEGEGEAGGGESAPSSDGMVVDEDGSDDKENKAA